MCQKKLEPEEGEADSKKIMDVWSVSEWQSCQTTPSLSMTVSRETSGNVEPFFWGGSDLPFNLQCKKCMSKGVKEEGKKEQNGRSERHNKELTGGLTQG